MKSSIFDSLTFIFIAVERSTCLWSVPTLQGFACRDSGRKRRVSCHCINAFLFLARVSFSVWLPNVSLTTRRIKEATCPWGCGLARLLCTQHVDCINTSWNVQKFARDSVSQVWVQTKEITLNKQESVWEREREMEQQSEFSHHFASCESRKRGAVCTIPLLSVMKMTVI